MAADDDLITRAKAGDGDAWRELYELHAGRLLVWLRHQSTGDAAAGAEDLLSETWLTAASKIADFSGTSDAFVGWLFAIARHAVSNVRRRSFRRATEPTATAEDHVRHGTEDTLVLQVHSHDVVAAMLAPLSERERQVITCIDVVGLDSGTTAAALGISRTAVRVARHRGLKRLRG